MYIAPFHATESQGVSILWYQWDVSVSLPYVHFCQECPSPHSEHEGSCSLYVYIYCGWAMTVLIEYI